MIPEFNARNYNNNYYLQLFDRSAIAIIWEGEREGGRGERETERIEEQLNDPYFFGRRPFTTITTSDW